MSPRPVPHPVPHPVPRPVSPTGLAGGTLLALALVAPLAGEEPSTFGERIDVELVTLDLLATRRSGEPVLDLERDEVRVYEDGEPVELEVFTAPSPTQQRGETGRRTGGASAGVPARAAPPTRLVVFVDRLHGGVLGRKLVLGQLADVLRRGLGPDDRVMVVAFDGTVDVRLPFTADRREVRAALEGLAEASARDVMIHRSSERALELLQTFAFNDQEAGAGGWADSCVRIGEAAQAHAEEVHGRVVSSLRAMERFVDSLAGVAGRKVLLHVSDGLPLVAGGEAWRYAIEMCDGTALRAGIENAFDVTSMTGVGRYTRFDPLQARADMANYDTTEFLRELTARANAQGVTFYPLQAGGPVGHGSARVDAVRTTLGLDTFRRRNLEDSLGILAHETGGRRLHGTHDYRDDLAEMLGEGELRYQLAYRPPTPGDGRRHAIRVATDRDGLVLRYRRSYLSRRPEQRVVEGVLASLFHGLGGNPLGASLEIDRGPRRDGAEVIVLRVGIPLDGLTLVPDAGGRGGVFSVYAVARRADGVMTPVRTRSIPVRVGEEEPGEERFVYEIEMSLPPASHEIVVGIRDDLGGEASYLRRRVDLG